MLSAAEDATLTTLKKESNICVTFIHHDSIITTTTTTTTAASGPTNNDTSRNNSTHSDVLVYQELLTFLQTPQRPDLRLEATKAVLQCVGDRNESLSLIEHGVIKPLLQIISMGGAGSAIEIHSNRIKTTTTNNNGTNNDDIDIDEKTTTMMVQASLNALRTVLYWTSSSVQEVSNMAVDNLLEYKAIPRLVEFILGFPSYSNNNNNRNNIMKVQSTMSMEAKQMINMSLAILANVSRTEQGAVELVGTTLPEEAIYSHHKEQERDTGENNHDKEQDYTRIKPTLELLLDRFIKTTPINITDKSLKEAMAATTTTTIMLESSSSPSSNTTTVQEKWDELWYPFDPYQHFAAILMNATQIKAGRQFVMRIPRTIVSTPSSRYSKPEEENEERLRVVEHQPQPPPQQQPSLSVLQRLLPQLQPPSSCSYDVITNPFRRRGIAGLIRNCCLETESAWWLLHVCKVLTPLLLPLAGPEELDIEDKRGLDPELWIRGVDQQRDIDAITRLYCIESILLLCATGRANRNTIRLAKTYVILKYCDMVEESEDISARIEECVQYLRRDEEGTAEGSSDQLVEQAIIGKRGGGTKVSNDNTGLLLPALTSTRITAASGTTTISGNDNGEDYNDVD